MTDKSPMKPPYPKFVIAPEGQFERHTARNEYAVTEPDADGFFVEVDSGPSVYALWRECAHLNHKNWIIPTEPEEAPEWALREACKRAGIDYQAFLSWREFDPLKRSVRAHALTIAKTQAPPVTQEQRGRVARVAMCLGVPAQSLVNGTDDKAVLAAIQAMDAEQ